MSVAFRRESDEEHKEPRFEIPLPTGPNLVTERGLAQIRARIQELQDRLAAQPPEGERTEAERDLRYWKTRQATAQIAPTPNGEEAAIGTRVTIRLNGAERTLSIVGHDEADPSAGYVSFAAPLAVAILGSCVGDRVNFAGKPEAVEIVEIAPLS
ncbi:MAG: nucleoside-diphosphate kinase [Alphaproteobacteria bacterium]|nr:MAG: nucleoside-diphosphate kinase [Alphaproteobacteria bacterium]